MMKYIFTFFLLSLTVSMQAQISRGRKLIKGKIKVDRYGEPSGINVFDLSSGGYTFTDKYGRFKIHVKEQDTLVFSSVQYQQFSVIITRRVIQKGRLSVNLKTTPVELEEVVVRPDLTGDATVDVKKLKTERVNLMENKSADLVYGYEYKFTPDRWSTVENDAFKKGYLEDGLNFINIFKALFRQKKTAKKRRDGKTVDVELRKMYEDSFFQRYIGIDKDHINEFIFFLESQGLDKHKIQTTNDLALIQFILQEGRVYKAREKK